MTRRLLVAATLAVAAAGTVGATAATADTTPVRTSSGDYIACAGVRTVNVAVCVEEPVGPILDLLPR